MAIHSIQSGVIYDADNAERVSPEELRRRMMSEPRERRRYDLPKDRDRGRELTQDTEGARGHSHSSYQN